MKLRSNSSYGYHFMDRSRHSNTAYTNVERRHSVIKNKTFKSSGHNNYQLQEAALAKSEIEHKEPLIVGFFILQFTK